MEKLFFDEVKPFEVASISSLTKLTDGMAFRSIGMLSSSQKKGNLLACRSGQKLVGFIEITDFANGCSGISSLFVLPKYRGKKIATKLIIRACDHLKNKYIFTSTSNMGLKKVLKHIGFRKIEIKNVPFEVFIKWFIYRNLNVVTFTKLLQKRIGKLELFERKPL